MPAGTALRLTTVIGAGGLTPEVFDVLRELMANNDNLDPDVASAACPHLTECGTKTGTCPVLGHCGTFHPLVEVDKVKAKD